VKYSGFKKVMETLRVLRS